MNYGHEFITVGPEDSELVECRYCAMRIPPNSPNEGIYRRTPCPERIVQEVERRIKAALRGVNVLPARRKDRK
jgi:hypothetical protein